MHVYFVACTAAAGDVGRHGSAHDTLPAVHGLDHAGRQDLSSVTVLIACCSAGFEKISI